MLSSFQFVLGVVAVVLAIGGLVVASTERHREQFWARRPSVYVALVGWGCTAFTAQPYFASLFVHFFIFPVILGLVVWLAHHEGMRKSRT